MKGAILMPKQKDSIMIDKKNEQILQMLLDNARTPVSLIAKKVKLSKPAVLNRIKNLEKKQIILQYISYYNLSNAGYKLYTVLFETTKESEIDTSKKLTSCSFTAAITLIAAKFNILWMVFAKSKGHLDQLIRDTTKNIKIKDLRLFPISKNFFDSYRLFDNKQKPIHQIKNTQFKLDGIDAEILDILKTNSRESLVHIANKCNLTAEAINQRIKKLLSNNIILRFFTNFNIFKLGFQPYMIFIKTNRQKQENVMRFIRSHKNTNGQYFVDNEFDIMCVVVIKDISELREFIEKLHLLFPDSILDYETYLIIDQIYNNFFPKGVYDDILISSNSTL